MRPARDLLEAALLPRRTPVLVQTEAAECGLACLAMIAGRHGHRLDLPALRQRYNLSLKGTTLRDLVGVAKQLGLATRALRAELPHLPGLRLPATLHWDHNHFVVLVSVGPYWAVIHDPAVGRRRVSLRELSRHFTGIALEAWPTPEFERKTERARVRVFDLLSRASGFWGTAGRVLLISLVIELLMITVPIGFQIALDEVVVSSDRGLLILLTLGLAVLVGFRAFIEFIRSWSVLVVGSTLTLQWKQAMFQRLLKLPLSFFERRHVGDIASRFVSLDRIQQGLGLASVSSIADGIMTVVLIVMMGLYNVELAAIAVAATTLYAVLRLLAWHMYRRANEDAIVNAARENSHFIESLRGIPSIKALGIGDQRQTSWGHYLSERINAELRVQRVDAAFGAASSLFFGLDRILILYLGVVAVLDGGLTVGMLVAFLAYKDQFSQKLSASLDTLIKMGLLSVHGERIADIALAHAEAGGESVTLESHTGVSHAGVSHAGSGRLTARGLGFRYGDNEAPVVVGFELDVKAGECVAIAGPSGAGKTTVLKMLAGLLAPTDGAILVDDIPVRAIGMEAHRTRIGCVLQDDRLFAGSIADNIAAFDPVPDRERVQHAAKLAAIHNEISRMPMGYETLVGDMGSALSGGQAQRVILARALYRRPRILLLDEATSHLDDENERAINDAIRHLPITRVIVAHRRSTLEMADRIVPLWPASATQRAQAGPAEIITTEP
jgi:ATP-binding cassette subfamily B protein RaxB